MQPTAKFTALHRILHWTMAIAMPILFITGFLRLKWMNKKEIAAIIKAEAGETVLSKEQLNHIGAAIREPMWEWHEIFANVMFLAIIARLLYMVFKGIRFPNPFQKNSPFKQRFQGFIYIYFYIFVIISAVTGFLIEKEIFKQAMETIETLHKFGLYWFPIFILLHLAGIVIAEFTTRKGITSKMISGD